MYIQISTLTLMHSFIISCSQFIVMTATVRHTIEVRLTTSCLHSSSRATQLYRLISNLNGNN